MLYWTLLYCFITYSISTFKITAWIPFTSFHCTFHTSSSSLLFSSFKYCSVLSLIVCKNYLVFSIFETFTDLAQYSRKTHKSVMTAAHGIVNLVRLVAEWNSLSCWNTRIVVSNTSVDLQDLVGQLVNFINIIQYNTIYSNLKWYAIMW